MAAGLATSLPSPNPGATGTASLSTERNGKRIHAAFPLANPSRLRVRLHGSPSSNNPVCTKLVVRTFVSNGAVNLKQTAAGCASLGVTQWAGTNERITQ